MTTTVTFPVKTKGEREYNRVTAVIKKSLRGNRLLYITDIEPMSERKYYATPASERVVLHSYELSEPYLHSIGHGWLFAKLLEVD
jgi:hypothetical protein